MEIQKTNQSNQRFVLKATSSEKFCDDLLWTIASGGVPVLLPNLQEGTLQKFSAEYDQVLNESYEHLTNSNRADLLPQIRSNQEIHFFTSGSAGEPKKIIRKWDQLVREVSVIEKYFGQNEAQIVAATVSAQHIYGFLFRILWPLLTGRKMWAEQISFPEDLKVLDAKSEKYILISSPAFLKRMNADQDTITNCCRVISSGGKLEAHEARLAHACFGIFADEIYGSTETSGIAFRKQDDNNPFGYWAPLDSVHVSVSEDGFLSVQSDFISGQTHLTGDLAVIQGDGRFLLRGRGDRIAKIEEKRVSLAEIEFELSKSEFVDKAVALTFDSGRQQIYCVVQLSNLGKQVLENEGKQNLGLKLKGELKNHFDSVLLPRKFRYVEEIPVNTQSKVDFLELRKLFDNDKTQLRKTDPDILEIVQADGKATITLRVDENLEYFKGHFDGFPILPGVVQVDWAMRLAKQIFKEEILFRGFQSIKFMKPIKPNSVLDLILQKVNGSTDIQFTYQKGERIYAAGKVQQVDSV